VIKTLKRSNDPLFEDKKNRILELYAIASGTAEPGPGNRTVVICVDEFGPLNLLPHLRRHRAPKAVGKGSTDRLYGHVVTNKDRTAFIRLLRCVRSLHPSGLRIAIVLDNFSPHLSTKKDQRVDETTTREALNHPRWRHRGDGKRKTLSGPTLVQAEARREVKLAENAAQPRVARTRWRRRKAVDGAHRRRRRARHLGTRRVFRAFIFRSVASSGSSLDATGGSLDTLTCSGATLRGHPASVNALPSRETCSVHFSPFQ